jgi:hypothetical protein
VDETTSTSTSGRLIPKATSDVPLSTEIFIAGKAVRTVAVIGYIFLSLAVPLSEVCKVASPPSLLNSDSYIPFTKRIVRYLTHGARVGDSTSTSASSHPIGTAFGCSGNGLNGRKGQSVILQNLSPRAQPPHILLMTICLARAWRSASGIATLNDVL